MDSIKLWINKARQAEIFKAGNAEALIEWYENGADGQIDWGQPGDFEQCVEIAGQYLENPEGFCQLRHIGATGEPSGHAEGEVSKATFHGNQYKDVASEGQQPTGGGGPRRVDPGRYQVGGGKPPVGQPQPGGNTAPDNTSPLAGVKPNPSSNDVGEKVLKPADDTSKGMRQFAERVLTAINRGDQPVIDRKDLAKMFLGMRGGIDKKFMKSDITELRIDGTRLMGRDGLGYGRKDMPQVETSQRDQFMADIEKSDGITHTKEDVDPTTLKPVQKEVFAVKSAGIFRSFQKTGIPDKLRILISKDGYVLDGHHTWAAGVAIHFLTGKSLPVYRLSVDHEEALAITTKWANENNAENQGQGKPTATKKSLDFSTETLLREYMTLELEKAFFHGNQYKQGEGGGKAKPARQVDEGRFQAVGRFGDKAEAVAQKPASDDHRALAKGHREAVATLQKMQDEETRPELKDSLQKAIDHHEHAADRHDQAANFHDDPNVPDKVKQGSSETARDMSKLADHLTDKAQEAYAWAKPIFGHRRAA